MRRLLALAALALIGAAPAAPVKLWRLDCGTLSDQDAAPFSDAHALDGQRLDLVDSCYLIRHGGEWMLWDAGLPLRFLGPKPAPTGERVRVTIAAQLARLGIAPARIGRVGISHYHYDHTGQLAAFPRAKLLIGAADLAVLRGTGDAPGIERESFAAWTKAGGRAQGVTGDLDVFGDGSVVMLALPGHTPGHHGLLVRLAHRGAVLLTGDLAHSARSYAMNEVPAFNTDRARSLSSLARFRAMAHDLRATTVIQHEPADVAKLPPFPEYAD